MSDDFGDRPLKTWPIWMLQALVKMRRRKSMWTDAYLELLERSNDACKEFAEKSCGKVWAVRPPNGMN